MQILDAKQCQACKLKVMKQHPRGGGQYYASGGNYVWYFHLPEESETRVHK